MDTDGGPGRDDLWPNILEGAGARRSAVQHTHGFYPVAVFGRADVVSQLGTLNYDTAEAELLTPELGYSTVFGTQLTRADFLKYSLELGEFIDYENRKSDFTGESFCSAALLCRKTSGERGRASRLAKPISPMADRRLPFPCSATPAIFSPSSSTTAQT